MILLQDAAANSDVDSSYQSGPYVRADFFIFLLFAVCLPKQIILFSILPGAVNQLAWKLYCTLES